jgi:predicted  nucleic acid-binding Zn-ribbon protein
VKSELEKLIALQNSDTSIKKLKKAILSVDTRRVSLEQEFEARAFEIRTLRKKRDDANVEKQRLETEIAAAKNALAKAEAKLKESQNQKQYEAAIREKTVFQKQISDLETAFLEKSEVADEAEKILATRADEIAKLEAERSQTFADFERQIIEEKRQLEIEQQNRRAAFESLPKNLANSYERLVNRIRDGVAVAEVKNGACSACSIKIRPQVVVDLRMSNQILNCENCGRILYVTAQE